MKRKQGTRGTANITRLPIRVRPGASEAELDSAVDRLISTAAAHATARQERERSDVSRSVIRVGDGRGFVVAGKTYPLVVTAGHCLPHLPPSHGVSYTEERTYRALLGPLGRKPTVWAECLFVDPVSDLAVLGEPDNQELWKQAEAYRKLMESVPPILVADSPTTASAWMLSLKGEWFKCTARHNGGRLAASDCAAEIEGGMSGSPIILADGAAIGVVSVGGYVGGKQASIIGGQPRLAANLPRWLLREIMDATADA